MGEHDEVEPDFSDLNKLREHQIWKMEQWYASGNFWYTPAAKDGAPLLLIGKGSSDIKEKYILTAAPKVPKASVTGTYISKKKEKQFHFSSGSNPDLSELRGKLLSICSKSITTYYWNKNELAGEKESIEAISERLMKRDLTAQMATDVEAWNGAIAQPGDKDIAELLKKIFTILVHGGLIYRENDKSPWKWWEQSKMPVASVISHGGRVMIQTPRSDTDFIKWLIPAKFMKMTRPFATHGITQEKADTGLAVEKHISESRGKWTAVKELVSRSKHLGINVPLFGHGNTNPFSGSLVSANGEHGHLYIHYLSSSSSQSGGLLIGCEGSEAGKTDQFGHKHDAKAKSSDISPTGGLKWRHNKCGPGGTGEANDTLFLNVMDSAAELMKLALVTDTGMLVKRGLNG